MDRGRDRRWVSTYLPEASAQRQAAGAPQRIYSDNLLPSRGYSDRPMNNDAYRAPNRGARSPPRTDGYRMNRSPPRRGQTPPPDDNYRPSRGGEVDTYHIHSERRRSRSPAYRGRGGGEYRGRARSPPRYQSPPRNGRPRSPVPPRKVSRSPVRAVIRDRSPPPYRRREPSPPVSYRQRSPLPAKRERFNEPEPRDRRYSPARDTGPRGPPPREPQSREPPSRFARENNYRPRRSPSPAKRPAPTSRGYSPVSSHRSSPPVAKALSVGSRSPPINPRADPHRMDRSPPRRARSLLPRSPLPPQSYERPRERERERERSPIPPRDQRDREMPRDPHDREMPLRAAPPPHPRRQEELAPPREPYRNGDARLAPRGPPPSRYENYPRGPAPGPPSGPSSAPISMSAHNRPSSNSILAAPTQPRAGAGLTRDDPRDPYSRPPPGPSPRGGRGYGAPPPRYPSRGDHSGGPGRGYNDRYNDRYNAPPHAPPPRTYPSYADEAPRPFRSNNSSSTTYPRTQRFSQLASVPAVVPGGEKMPSGLDPAQEKRLQQLEEDKRKLQEVIDEKQRLKRMALREWEKGEREIRREGLRSELAEQSLEKLSGDGSGSGGY